MSVVEKTNQKIVENDAQIRVVTAVQEFKRRFAQEGQQLKKAEQSRAQLLEGAEWPLQGLSVGDSGVTYNGVSIDELSTSEKIRVGASIAVAQKPKARVILADDVSLLDGDNLAILHEICRGFQLWQVVNDDSGDVGFYIEAGEIK
jgi:hypothetical protein